MTENSVFTKKHSEAMAQDKRAILEELNLPPAMVTYIRQNSSRIKIIGITLVIAILAWEGYGKYTSIQRDKSSVMLYEATQLESDEERGDKLAQLTEKYAATGSGVWGKVELGHIAFKDGKFEDAVSMYSEALTKISQSNPLYPLIQFSLAQSYENINDSANAKAAFTKLSTIAGFAGESHLGLARLAEKDGKYEEALASYQEYINLPETQPGPTKDWVDSKIVEMSSK